MRLKKTLKYRKSSSRFGAINYYSKTKVIAVYSEGEKRLR